MGNAMHKIMHAAILSTLLTAGAALPALAAADTKVLDHHVASMKAGETGTVPGTPPPPERGERRCVSW